MIENKYNEMTPAELAEATKEEYIEYADTFFRLLRDGKRDLYETQLEALYENFEISQKTHDVFCRILEGAKNFDPDEQISLCTFPESDENYCHEFVVHRYWLELYLVLANETTYDTFMCEYTWDNTYFAYLAAKADDEIVLEEEVP